ncbi:hypothetical protein EMCRGX_G031146 [Ephydatia muelleri]
MSSSTHVERTHGIARGEVVSNVLVREIRELSPAIKGFTLHVCNPNLTFRPGQWVDLHIPEENIVGGYSITSTPLCLQTAGTIDLAIQYSTHPPAHWMHTKCKVADKLSIQVGGDFYYYPSSPGEERELLLVAGGMGINPLFSILQHQVHAHSSWKVKLLFVARTASSLLFKDQLERLCANSDAIEVQYFVTREVSLNPKINSCRITREDLTQAVATLDLLNLFCFVCGPPPMTDNVIQCLRDVGVPQNCIQYEKWW